MDKSAISFTTVQIALGFASYNFPVAMQFFPKLHSRPCDYLYKLEMCSVSTNGERASPAIA